MVGPKMKRAYDQIAGQYAERYSTMPLVLVKLGMQLLEHLPGNPAILDVGCGNGRDMAWFESQGAQVTGIDLSPGMLAQARPHVTGPLWEMDMLSLTLPDHTFDAIWCMAALLHIPKVSAPKVLSGFRRVLKDDGLLVLGLQEGTTEGWEPSIYTNIERFFARYQSADVDELLSNAGFAIVSHVRHGSATSVWLHIIAQGTHAGS